MIDLNKNYWFFLEPYVYCRVENDTVLLFNTLDSSFAEENNPDIIMLINNLLLKENNGVILLDKNQFSKPIVFKFINSIREKFFGDIIDTSLSKLKPIQLTPYLNLQRDVFRDYNETEFPINKIDLAYLHEISILVSGVSDQSVSQIGGMTFLPGNTSDYNILSIQDLIAFLEPLSKIGINSLQIQGNNLFEYSYLDLLLRFLSTFPSKKTFIIDCLQLNDSKLSIFKLENSKIQLLVKSPFIKDLINRFVFEVDSLRIQYNILFIITNEEEFAFAENLIESLELKEYILQPFYTGINLEFFHKRVFLNKGDILSSSLSMKEIFAHQKLNTNYFGKLLILPDGDVFANIFMKSLGNIKTDSIYEIVQKEMFKGEAWLKIRYQKPCSGCIYQWLCPSPSDYELAIGKPNLCHVI
jgi:pseudo-rSAM protein